jgi:hypothetical protein
MSEEKKAPVTMGPIKAKITINLHTSGYITCSFPENAAVVMQMLAGFLNSMCDKVELKKESNIIQVPFGTIVK